MSAFPKFQLLDKVENGGTVKPVFYDHRVLRLVAIIRGANVAFYVQIHLFSNHLSFTTKIIGTKQWS